MMRWLSFLLILFSPLACASDECEIGAECPTDEEQLHVSINIDQGQKLLLSNGSTYEIAPIDQHNAAYWITPFPIELSESGDPNYPVKITNMHTGTFVRGKQVITSEAIEEERQKRLEKTQPQMNKNQP